jgi:hypothetical protein
MLRQPSAAVDAAKVIARLREDHGVPVYEEHAPTHEFRDSWRRG